jgi:hypothetical protein
MEQRTNRSEVARLLDQIELEYVAATRGLTDFAESARHRIISARQERLGRLHEQLQKVAGDEAIHLFSARLDALTEREDHINDSL